MNLSFQDQTYSSSNKPSSATLKTDLQTIETEFNAHEADTSAHGVSGAVVGTSDTQTLTNKAITFTDTTISMNVKSRAYAGTNQSFSSGTGAKVQLDTESYDIGSDFDHATNYRFTAPVTGYYLIVAKVAITSPADQALLQIDIQKNGADLFRISSATSSTNDTSLNGSDIQYLSSGDYIEMRFTQSSGSSKNIISGAGNTYMCVHLLSI